MSRRIVIRPTGDAFSIAIEPPPEWTGLDRERPTLRDARRYAEGLRIVHGWKVADQTKEADHGRA